MALPQLYRNRITALVAVTVFGFAGTLTAAVTAEAVGRSAAADLPANTRTGTGTSTAPGDGTAHTVVVVRGAPAAQALSRP
ncbi:hypothetical protein [Streptomyces huiliensis]|uniref:hypothetical protein n=1 Tax=Streptomyces huiliensis TaxID=2876027 RepID=UPI001CBB1FE1|nr:hypothetical protein [Streptomyces huiliensis]MBZ4321119.1 hypothetical protein [Streptomyces huiliensis]